jgi:hypothetical protein
VLRNKRPKPVKRRKESQGEKSLKGKEMIMNPTLATLLIISVTVIAAILVLILIFFIPVLLQVRRTAHKDPEAGVPPWAFGL